MLIVGICGYAGAGKDTAADAILRALALYPCGRASFADPMRCMLSALGVPDAYMTNRELKEKPVPGLGLSYRHLAQTLGTEWGRQCNGKDFWITALRAKLNAIYSSGSVVVIPDVRFPNEALWVQQEGGIMIRVIRGDAAPVNPHESEKYVMQLPVDVEVMNTTGERPVFEKAVVYAFRAEAKAKGYQL